MQISKTKFKKQNKKTSDKIKVVVVPYLSLKKGKKEKKQVGYRIPTMN